MDVTIIEGADIPVIQPHLAVDTEDALMVMYAIYMVDAREVQVVVMMNAAMMRIAHLIRSAGVEDAGQHPVHQHALQMNKYVSMVSVKTLNQKDVVMVLLVVMVNIASKMSV